MSTSKEEAALLKLIKLHIEEYNLAEKAKEIAEEARVEASNKMDAVLYLYCDLRKGEEDSDITIRMKEILTALTHAAESRRRILKDLVDLDTYRGDSLRQLQERAEVLLDGDDYGPAISNPSSSLK